MKQFWRKVQWRHVLGTGLLCVSLFGGVFYYRTASRAAALTTYTVMVTPSPAVVAQNSSSTPLSTVGSSPSEATATPSPIEPNTPVVSPVPAFSHATASSRSSSSSSIKSGTSTSKPKTTSKPTPKPSNAVVKKINLMTATETQLETLPKIGPAKAAAILVARQQGLIKKVDDLDKVKGIGPKTLELLRPYLE